jgi:flotillin
MAALDTMVIVVLLAFVMILYFGIYAKQYKKVPPNMAMVVFGKRQAGTRKGYRVISGGAKFIVPLLESYAFLPLDVRTITLDLKNVPINVENTRSKINIKCTAQVKISSDPRILDTAAEHLLNKPDEEINEIARKTLKGHVRGICALMKFKEIDADRDMMAGKIQMFADKDLKNMGLEIRSFVIQEVEDLGEVSRVPVSSENLEKQVRTILEKLLKEKGINPG